MTYEYDFCLRCGRPGHCSADCTKPLPPSEGRAMKRTALALLLVALTGCTGCATFNISWMFTASYNTEVEQTSTVKHPLPENPEAVPAKR